MNRFRIFILGALNGALYSAIMLVMVWQLRAYEDARSIKDAATFGHLPVQLTSNERWVPIVVTWILIFTFAAPVVAHFWHGYRTSSVLFWEVVGLIAVSAWNVLVLFAFWIEKQSSSQMMSYDWVTSSSNPIFGPISLGVVLIVNFIYACAIRVFEKATAARVG